MARQKPAETPLMKQFLSIKAKHPDGILFFRMGDFYEMFFEDAKVAAEALDLTLTSRDKGKKDSIPMCGLPHHASRSYIARLNAKGHTVVVCEQVEDPKKAKGLVKRDVVQIVTPGVVVDEGLLEPSRGFHLVSLSFDANGTDIGVVFLDVSTGEFGGTLVKSQIELEAELTRIMPREVLVADTLVEDKKFLTLKERLRELNFTVVPPSENQAFLFENTVGADVAQLGLGDKPSVVVAAVQAIEYAQKTHPVGVLPIVRFFHYSGVDTVLMDETAVANLELCKTLVGANADGALIEVLDKTKSAHGGRLLRKWLLFPSTQKEVIERRLDAVESWVSDQNACAELRKSLNKAYDLQRLGGRVSLGHVSPYDLNQLRGTINLLPEIIKSVSKSQAKKSWLDPKTLKTKELFALSSLLDEALEDDCPRTHKNGGFIKDSFCVVVKKERKLAKGAKDTVAQIETREKERLGFPLKIKHNRVFGYFIEITKTHVDKAPDDYKRKQTIANGERFVTDELKELQVAIENADLALKTREIELWDELVEKAKECLDAIMALADWLASVDVCSTLAFVATHNQYTRPVIDDSTRLSIKAGRHPVVEQHVGVAGFVPNDMTLDTENEQIALITGPNMAGKSTTMRQVAQIVLMAQMGSFVPAESAEIGLVDKIFTRVGATDNLSRGDSTFMVEMKETSAILRHATSRSLLILDEVGRGTSTYDGLSIAWATVEYIHDAVGARTLFATHYHELTQMSKTHSKIKNAAMTVKEQNGDIVFLRRLKSGTSDKSFGIQVAKLAGLPKSVVARASQILKGLEESSGSSPDMSKQMSFELPPPLVEDSTSKALESFLENLDIDSMTPLEALLKLSDLKSELSRH